MYGEVFTTALACLLIIGTGPRLQSRLRRDAPAYAINTSTEYSLPRRLERYVGVVLLLSDPLGEAAGGAVPGDEGGVGGIGQALHRQSFDGRAAEPGRSERRAFRSRRPLGSAVARPASQVTAAAPSQFTVI